jgi:hypothetical protein
VRAEILKDRKAILTNTDVMGCLWKRDTLCDNLDNRTMFGEYLEYEKGKQTIEFAWINEKFRII